MAPEAHTAVVVDTTSYLPEELIDRYGIHRVSLYVTLDGEQKRESEISAAEYDDFYERLRRSDAGATTSQPSVGDFREVYEPLLADGREIVSIHLSAGISGTCESARQARQQLIDEGKGGERIMVFDSRSACGGSGASGRRRRPCGRARICRHRRPRDRRARPRRPQDVVRDRHARVPAKGRSDRLRAGVARLGATDQADPDARGGDHARRARPHPPPRVRADGRVRPRAPPLGRRRLGRPAHPRPARPPGTWSTSAGRSSARTRSSSPRSAP